MRKTIFKATVSALALTVTCMAMPLPQCSAYSFEDYVYIAPKKEYDMSFVILGYSENNGELTITSCIDYSPDFKVSPFERGYIAVAVFNGKLEIPSHIDGKPVVDIMYLSNNTSFDTIIVPKTIDKILRSAYGEKMYAVEEAEKECRLITMYC